MILGKFCWFVSANSTCRGILLAGLLAAPAAAQSVTLDVEGEIEASCTLSGLAGTVSGLDFSVADSTSLNFTVDCNAPFAYALESSNQAFRTVPPFSPLPLPGSGTFLESVPYTVTTSFQTDGGGSFGNVAIASATLTSANTIIYTLGVAPGFFDKRTGLFHLTQAGKNTRTLHFVPSSGKMAHMGLVHRGQTLR